MLTELSDCIIYRFRPRDKNQPVSVLMKHRPIILSLTSMHESGLRILREATDLRMASALDPTTLQREVVGAEGLIIRTGGVIDAALLDRGNQLRVVGRHGVGYDQIDVAVFKSCIPRARTRKALSSTSLRS
jgi:phosphoglycerate dehydrogenase-like enzyme